MTKNPFLTEKNIQVRIFVGDYDSSSICTIEKASSHPILKQADTNHTSKGVEGLLYGRDKNSDPDRELTSDVIKYIHSCFTHCLHQNQGDEEKMAAAIRNIPFHAFKQHDDCNKKWCGY